MKFKKGGVGNPKGCPKGAHHKGRPVEWLREKCRKIVEDRKLIEFLADVAGGKVVERVKFPDGKETEMEKSAETKDRIKATDMLFDRAWGKAPQSLQDEAGNPLEGSRLIIIRAPNK